MGFTSFPKVLVKSSAGNQPSRGEVDIAQLRLEASIAWHTWLPENPLPPTWLHLAPGNLAYLIPLYNCPPEMHPPTQAAAGFARSRNAVVRKAD